MSSVRPIKNRTEKDFIINHIRLIPQDPSKTPGGQGYFDFSNHFVEFSFEESIFEMGVHASMFVFDAVDYPTLLPMIGEERIQISFTRIDEKSKNGDLLDPIEVDLPVYRMEGKMQDRPSRKAQTYTLYMCSDELYQNINSYVSRGFINEPYSKMVEKIYNQYLKVNKPIVIEETQGTANYFTQASSAAKTIAKIAKRSISSEGNGSFYVFYEDRDQFNYVTVGKLIRDGSNKEPSATFTYQLKNIAKESSGLMHKELDAERNLYNVDNIQKMNGFDNIRSALTGEATSSLLSVDPIRRKFKLNAFDLRGKESIAKHNLDLVSNSSWESFVHFDKAKPFTDKNKMFVNPLTNLKMLISDNGHKTNEYISTRDQNANSYVPEDFFLQRNSNKAQILKNVITTTVSGDPRIKAGCVVEFKIPETMGKLGKQNPEELDKYMQGKYLVVSVAHIITPRTYVMNLELIKDSLFSDIEARDPVEEYKNII